MIKSKRRISQAIKSVNINDAFWLYTNNFEINAKINDVKINEYGSNREQTYYATISLLRCLVNYVDEPFANLLAQIIDKFVSLWVIDDYILNWAADLTLMTMEQYIEDLAAQFVQEYYNLYEFMLQ